MSKKAKVMQVITRLDMGGSAQNTMLTCIGLADKYELVLIHGPSHESAMTGAERRQVTRQLGQGRQAGVQAITIPWLVRRIDPARDIAALLTLVRAIRRRKPDIVHTHTSKAGILGRLAAVMCGVPCIIHTPHGHVFYGHFARLLSKTFLLLEKLFDRFTDCTIALTEGEKKDYIDLGVSTSDKIVTIHSGVDVDRFGSTEEEPAEIKRSLGLNLEGCVIGFVGWLLPIKGPQYLLAAMAKVAETFPDVQLVLVGKGEQEAALKAAAEQLKITDRICFAGWREDIPAIMQVFDIFVLPSLNEGMGRVAVEAMAAGKPVVASRVGGIPDLVIDGVNGLLVEPADSAGLARAITKLLGSQDVRSNMGRRGRELAARFSIDKMIEKIDGLYSNFISE